MPDRNISGMPVIPNASLVRGRLLSVKPDPSGRGFQWAIVVEEARDIAGMPNFVREYVGKTISVHVQPEVKPGLVAHDLLEARLAYRGDERGGLFITVGDEIRKV